jgi:hypothetical protein
VTCNSQIGSERQRYDAAIRAERKAPKRSKGGPLASFGNAAIGVKRKSDTFDLAATGH